MTTVKVGGLEFNPNDTIGRGSSGTFVFKGSFHSSPNASEPKLTPVAIKRILKNILKENTDIQQEAKLMREASDHPNILHIIHTELNDVCFL